ncbi:MAG: YbfB/YjiJ family MFS transporter [Proteobacteria bacterium]|nr:YbfB/YjiJ family MFS transporter [Pseudomonadota bacterium]
MPSSSPIRLLLAGAAALALAVGIGRFAYTPVLPAMQEAAGFGAATAGWIAGWNYLGYLLGALAAAMVAARASRHRVLVASIAASILSTAAMGLAGSVEAWCALRFVSGLASAGVLVISSAIVLEALSGASRPNLLGAHFAGVGVGIALSGLVVALGVAFLDWRGLWFALAGASLALALLTLPLARPRGARLQGAPPPAVSKERFSAALLISSYFLEGLGYVVTGTFLVAIAKQMPGIGGAAEALWIAVGLAGAPSTLLWVRAAARWGAPNALIAAHLVQAVGIVLPVFFDALWVALLAAVFFGGTLMGITALIVSFGGRISEHPARMIGLLTAAFGLGQMIGPVIAGWLAERQGGFNGSLLLASGAVVLGAALITAGRTTSRA